MEGLDFLNELTDMEEELKEMHDDVDLNAYSPEEIDVEIDIDGLETTVKEKSTSNHENKDKEEDKIVVNKNEDQNKPPKEALESFKDKEDQEVKKDREVPKKSNRELEKGNEKDQKDEREVPKSREKVKEKKNQGNQNKSNHNKNNEKNNKQKKNKQNQQNNKNNQNKNQNKNNDNQKNQNKNNENQKNENKNNDNQKNENKSNKDEKSILKEILNEKKNDTKDKKDEKNNKENIEKKEKVVDKSEKKEESKKKNEKDSINSILSKISKKEESPNKKMNIDKNKPLYEQITKNEKEDKDNGSIKEHNGKQYIVYKNGVYIDKETGKSATLEEIKAEAQKESNDLESLKEDIKNIKKEKKENKEDVQIEASEEKKDSSRESVLNKIKKEKSKEEPKKEVASSNKEDKVRHESIKKKGVNISSNGKDIKDTRKMVNEALNEVSPAPEETALMKRDNRRENDIFVEEELEKRKHRGAPPIKNTLIAKIFLTIEELFENLRYHKLSAATMYKKVLEEDLSPADILAHVITSTFLGAGLVNLLDYFSVLGRPNGLMNSLVKRKIRFAFTLIALSPILKLVLIALLGSVFNLKRGNDRNKYGDTFKYIIINSYSRFLLVFIFNIVSTFSPALSVVGLVPIILKGGLKDTFNVSGVFNKRDISDTELILFITLYYVIILGVLRYLYLF